MRHSDGPWQADEPPAVKPLAQHGWRRVLWQLTRINVGPSPDDLYEFDLYDRIRRTAHFVQYRCVRRLSWSWFPK